MVGWFDAVEKGSSLRYCGFEELVINKLDALTLDKDTEDSDLKICVAYRSSDGNIIRDVPRSESITQIFDSCL